MGFLSSFENFSRRAHAILLIDAVVSVMASVVVLLFFRWYLKPIPDFQDFVIAILFSSLAFAIFSDLVVGTQKIIIRYSSVRSISKLIEAVLLKEALLFVLVLVGPLRFSTLDVCGIAVLFDFIFTLISRIIIRVFIVLIYENIEDDMEVNVGRFNVIVYGVSDKSVAMVTRLEQSVHYNVLGFLSPSVADKGMILMDHKVYHISGEEDFAKLKIALGIQGLLFSREVDADAEKADIVPMALHLGVHILSVPRIEESHLNAMLSGTAGDVDESDFIPDGMTALGRQIKRISDLCLSMVLIVVFSPLMLVCAIAVKLYGGPGPVIFKQERIGRFGRPFNIYKFRTMREDAEPDGAALYAGDDDPRLTKVGHFLRVHHLDELPQLFNVFRGDMAFVGYRPERKFFIEKIMEQDPRYYYLYQIRPGVTSYATLRNGYADTMQKMLRRLEFDLYYLRNRSAWFDVKILCQTFVNIVFGKKF